MATVIETTAAARAGRRGRKRQHGVNQAGKQMHGSKLTYVILSVVVLISIFPFYWTILAASTFHARGITALTSINQAYRLLSPRWASASQTCCRRSPPRLGTELFDHQYIGRPSCHGGIIRL